MLYRNRKKDLRYLEFLGGVPANFLSSFENLEKWYYQINNEIYPNSYIRKLRLKQGLFGGVYHYLHI